LLNPIYWMLSLLWLTTHDTVIHQVFAGPTFYLGGLGLYVGNLIFVYLSIAGALVRGHHGLVKYTLLSPLYWMLMSVGAWKGVLHRPDLGTYRPAGRRVRAPLPGLREKRPSMWLT
jgi:hypothetical protein